MNAVALAAAAVTALAAAVLVLAEQRGWERVRFAAKPLASLGFIAVAVASGGFASTPGRFIVAATVLAFGGDVLLLPRGAKRTFVAGLGVFLAAHVAFAGAFVAAGVAWSWAAASLVPLAAVGAPIVAWLLPRAPERLRVPVAAYMVVITAMVALAAGAAGAGAPWWLPVAAAAFWASDVAVARERFVARSFVNKLVGLPLYYAAVTALAFGAAAFT